MAIPESEEIKRDLENLLNAEKFHSLEKDMSRPDLHKKVTVTLHTETKDIVETCESGNTH